jgi:hypothetical protein
MGRGAGGGAAADKVVHREFYDLVGCEPGAGSEEIKKAYRKAALRLHPDRGGNEEDFKKMKAAYDTISDPNKRKVYDKYGAQAIRAMEGEVPNPMEFLGTLRKRDRVLLVLFITVLSLVVLCFPILLSVRWDQVPSGTYSWAVAFIPLWLLQGLFVVLFFLQFNQPPLDKKNPDVDVEMRQAYDKTERELNVVRAKVAVLAVLLFLFEALLVTKLDGKLPGTSWYLVLLPLYLLLALMLAMRVASAAAVFASLDPRFNKPHEEGDESHRSSASACDPRLLSDIGFWFFAFMYVKWTLAGFITVILIAAAAQGDISAANAFFLAVIPILIISGLALLGNLLAYCLTKKPDAQPQQQQQQQQQQQPDAPQAGSVVGVVLQWACTHGMILIIVLCGAAKLQGGSLSAFAIFSPLFFIVGCLCCSLSLVALTLNPEDMKNAAQQAQAAEAQAQAQAQQQQQQQQQPSYVPVPVTVDNATESVQIQVS